MKPQKTAQQSDSLSLPEEIRHQTNYHSSHFDNQTVFLLHASLLFL